MDLSVGIGLAIIFYLVYFIYIKKLTFIFYIFLVFLPTSFTYAEETGKTMNGFTVTHFGEFSKLWQLVTVRFRKDTGEMRITYANPKAWAVLKNNKINYEDGAVFAKISILTKDDPAFPSSVVPSGARRVQFMVKDKKKFASTEGWGYALFDSTGHTYPGDLKEATMACAACHSIVPERGYVFSQPMDVSLSSLQDKNEKEWGSRLVFKKINRKNLPKNVLEKIPAKYEWVHSLQGEIAKKPFAGTLDEIRPLLAQESSKHKIPSLLLSQDEKIFSLVLPESQKKCDTGEKGMKGIHTIPGKKESFYNIDFCMEEKN
jgi:hypothetical protein